MNSYIATPIRMGDMTLGFLNVGGVRSNQFSPADVQRLQSFSRHAAAAIENSRLHRELRDHAERLEERVRSRTAQLEAQYARLEAILDSTADGILVTDAKGKILQTNPPAHTWLTRTLSPKNAERLGAAVRDLVLRLEEHPREMLELTGLDVELRATPISQRAKDEAAAVIAIHDVSELKALDRTKTRFVSNVSHELRTPVTTIKLYTTLMQRTEPAKWRDYLGALAEEADRQVQLVENILQISRIDAGRMEMNRRSISINELTAATVTRHQVMAQDRGQRLTHRPKEPGPVGWVDEDQMIQVLNNLVENSIYYTPDGGEVTVSTGTAQADGRTWVTATVTDTGVGIPESEMPHIFERFHRGEGPLQIQAPGTGLGLAIAKEIAELHGGWITVESKVNVGSTFTVWLPVAE